MRAVACVDMCINIGVCQTTATVTTVIITTASAGPLYRIFADKSTLSLCYCSYQGYARIAHGRWQPHGRQVLREDQDENGKEVAFPHEKVSVQ